MRSKRQWVSQSSGSFHIISRIAGGDTLLNEDDKESLLKLLERFASGFFVQVHSFCILGSHIHILATGLELEAKNASKEELLHRYRLLYPNIQEPPEGSFKDNGRLIPDVDGGLERLRSRLGSVSRFIQELKQTFSRWYNKKHNRKGYLWGDRFKGVIVSKGEAQLVCSAYIDLNPVRANIVKRPEDYRWCSLGLRVRSPERANKLLMLLGVPCEEELSKSGIFQKGKDRREFIWYREFVYISGGIEREDKASISQELVEDVIHYHGKLGIGDRFRYRVRNISEGLAIGTHSFISEFQRRYERKFIRPRAFLGGERLFATRVLRL